MRKVHLGGQLADGVVAWRQDTQDALSELVSKQARDAVATFLDRGYLRTTIDEISRAAGVRIARPTEVLAQVGKHLRYTDAQQATILEHFISGGDLTSGGVLHAVTSTAQTLADADAAYGMELGALRAMEFAATTAR
jgi:hypothetical protein